MSVRILCPACKTSMSVNDSKRGSKVRCKECDKAVLVPDETSDAIQDLSKLKAKAALPARKRDADAPAERPSKNKQPKGAKTGFPFLLLVGGGVAAVLLFGVVLVAGVGGYFLFRSRPVEAGPNLAAKANLPGDDKEPPEPQVEPEPRPKAKPAQPLPDQMAPEVVGRVKQATVYLLVTMPNGQKAEGSGFFALEPGIIITNAHVLGMLSSNTRPPARVDVALNSGEAGETKLIGEVLGVDRACDLAVVRVPVNANMPVPLTFGDAPVFETQKVFIFGFPFGEKLGKNITVSASNVSALRLDPESRELREVQVNGGMHPGNSGGPVVNALGELVGVSVAVITGTQINFAVPAEKVRSIMEGRLAATKWGEPFANANDRRMPVEYKCFDPLNRIRTLKVEVWTGPAGPARPSASARPKTQAGDSPRQVHPVAYRDGVGSLEVPLPPLQAGEVYWLQPVLTTAKGTRWGPAQASTTAPAFVERKPANLTINLTGQKERTARMTSDFTITMSSGKKKSVISERTTASLFEVVQNAEWKGPVKTTPIKTAYAAMSITVDKDGKKIIIPSHQQAESLVRTMPPTFVIDDTNATTSYVAVNLSLKHPLRDLVAEFNGMVHNGFEATTFKMPNRVVQPLETFPSKSSMMLRTNAPRGPGMPATILDLILNCTYEGTRLRNGREEAVISVAGNLQGRLKLKGKIDGNITGKIGFDVAGGFISLAKIKIVAENEEQIAGLGAFQEIITQEIDLDRVAGNPNNLTLAPPKGGIPLPKDPKVFLPKDPEIVPKGGNPNIVFVKPMPSQQPTSYLKVDSSPGDFIGQGKSYAYTGDQLVVKKTVRSVTISVDGWRLEVAAPNGQVLMVGEYQNAKRFPFNGVSPGLSFSGNGRGSNRLAGEFVIWELEMDGDRIVRLAIDFVQRCEEVQPPLTGKLRVNSLLQ